MCLHALLALVAGGANPICNREGDAATSGCPTSTGHRIWTPVPGRRFSISSSGAGQRGCWPVRQDRYGCKSRAHRPTWSNHHSSSNTPDEACATRRRAWFLSYPSVTTHSV